MPREAVIRQLEKAKRLTSSTARPEEALVVIDGYGEPVSHKGVLAITIEFEEAKEFSFRLADWLREQSVQGVGQTLSQRFQRICQSAETDFSGQLLVFATIEDYCNWLTQADRSFNDFTDAFHDFGSPIYSVSYFVEP